MTIQEWGALGELIGGVAVIFTLVYLAVEVRRNTNATKGSAYQQYRAQFQQALSVFADPKVTNIYLAGRDSLDTLDDSERAVFFRAVTLMVNNYETLFYLRDLNVVDPRMVSDGPIKALFRHRGVKHWWNQRGSDMYAPAFVEHINAKFDLG